MERSKILHFFSLVYLIAAEFASIKNIIFLQVLILGGGRVRQHHCLPVRQLRRAACAGAQAGPAADPLLPAFPGVPEVHAELKRDDGMMGRPLE